MVNTKICLRLFTISIFLAEQNNRRNKYTRFQSRFVISFSYFGRERERQEQEIEKTVDGSVLLCTSYFQRFPRFLVDSFHFFAGSVPFNRDFVSRRPLGWYFVSISNDNQYTRRPLSDIVNNNYDNKRRMKTTQIGFALYVIRVKK